MSCGNMNYKLHYKKLLYYWWLKFLRQNQLDPGVTDSE